MDKRECAIVPLYTGVSMLEGDDLKHLYAYAEELLGEPMMTHDFLTCGDELKALAKPDFVALCKEAVDEIAISTATYHYEPVEEKRHLGVFVCDSCGQLQLIHR